MLRIDIPLLLEYHLVYYQGFKEEPFLAKDICLDKLRRRFQSESRCRRFLENVIWKNGRFCPHCASLKSWPIRHVTRKGLYECAACHRQFTVTVKTPFHSTKLPLWKWFQVIYLMLKSSGGESSVEIAKKVGVSQPTAWKVMHAIREMMDLRDEIGPVLKGVVEVDETYIGGKPRKRKGVVNKRGKGTKKQPVLVMAERKGKIRIAPIDNDSFDKIAPLLRQHICPGAVLMSDQHPVYQKIAPEFQAHFSVNHGKDEFARGNVHNNTCESVNSSLKKAYKGVYHWWSRRHQQRYLNEVAFRWNQRTPVTRKKFEGKTLVKEWIEMVELPFMEKFQALLCKAMCRQVRRSHNNGLKPLVHKTYHWPTATEITL